MPLYFLSFLLVISVAVTIHELGHYTVARLCGVRVETFSLGFGKKILGFRDKHGTEWKICILPLGGYVKMYGDTNAASLHITNNASITEEELKYSFVCKNVWQRFAIVIAGPLANFLLSLVLYFAVFFTVGKPDTAFLVSSFASHSPAKAAGIEADDMIISINHQAVHDIHQFRDLVNSTPQVTVTVTRKCPRCPDAKNAYISFMVHPVSIERLNTQGKMMHTKSMGINLTLINTGTFIRITHLTAFKMAINAVYNASVTSIVSLYEVATRQRSFKEIGGPIAIAAHSAKATQMGAMSLIMFMSLISVSLGVINLLPIPILDGGSLLLYIFEIIFRKPLPDRVQKMYYNIGLIIIGSVTIAVMINDIRAMITKF